MNGWGRRIDKRIDRWIERRIEGQVDKCRAGWLAGPMDRECIGG